MKDLQSIAKPCQLEMELAHAGTAMELIADEQLLTVQLSLMATSSSSIARSARSGNDVRLKRMRSASVITNG